MPKCTESRIGFGKLGRRVIEADFSGGELSSDGGLMLLRQVDERIGLTRAAARVLSDPRDPGRIRHTMRELLDQSVRDRAGSQRGDDDPRVRRGLAGPVAGAGGIEHRRRWKPGPNRRHTARPSRGADPAGAQLRPRGSRVTKVRGMRAATFWPSPTPTACPLLTGWSDSCHPPTRSVVAVTDGHSGPFGPPFSRWPRRCDRDMSTIA